MTPPPPVLEVISSQEVVAAASVLLAAVLGLLAAGSRWVKRWLEGHMEAVRADASAAAQAAARAEDQVTNSHDLNLRDDLDCKFDDLRARLDVLAARQESIEETREARDRRAEFQIDGLRDDLRDTSRRADATHARIEDRLTSLESQVKECHPPQPRPAL